MLKNNLSLTTDKRYGNVDIFLSTPKPLSHHLVQQDCDVSIAVYALPRGARPKVVITMYPDMLKRLNWHVGDRVLINFVDTTILLTLSKPEGYGLTDSEGRCTTPKFANNFKISRISLAMPEGFPIQPGNHLDFHDPFIFDGLLFLETIDLHPSTKGTHQAINSKNPTKLI